MAYKQFWQQLAEKILPQGRKQKELREKIKEKSNKLNEINLKNMTPAEKNDFIRQTTLDIKDLVTKNEKISKEELEKVVKCNEKFLRDSIEDWDLIDLIFVMSVVAVYIPLSRFELDEEKKSNIHNEHSGGPATSKLGNKAHHRMPNDTVPDGMMGIDNSTNRAGGVFKMRNSSGEDGKGVNHRYIYGHDVFKPWEIFKNANEIEGIIPIWGSKNLGIFVKQVYHLWYDLFSPTGLPAPGTTYFAKTINEKLSREIDKYNSNHPELPNKKMADEMQKFAIHIEDIIKSFGIEGLIQIYCWTRRTLKDVQNGENFFYWLQQFLCVDLKGKGVFMGDRTFKEYEIGMIMHMNIITIEASNGNFSWLSADLFFKDMLQWLRLNSKWKAEYKKYLIQILQEQTKCKIPEEMLSTCQELCQIYNIEFKNDAHYIVEKLESI